MRNFDRTPRDRSNDIIKPQSEVWYKGYCRKDGIGYYFIYQNIDGEVVNEKEVTSKEYNKI